MFPATSAASGWPFFFLGFDGVKHPNCIKCPEPPFQRIQGTVELSGVVTVNGKVDQLRVIKHVQPELDELSLKIMNTWLFEPAKAPDGSPVPVRMIFEVYFHP